MKLKLKRCPERERKSSLKESKRSSSEGFEKKTVKFLKKKTVKLLFFLRNENCVFDFDRGRTKGVR